MRWIFLSLPSAWAVLSPLGDSTPMGTCRTRLGEERCCSRDRKTKEGEEVGGYSQLTLVKAALGCSTKGPVILTSLHSHPFHSVGVLFLFQDSDHANSPPSRKQAKSFKGKARYSNSDSQWSHCLGKAGGCSQHLVLPEPPAYTGPQDLATFLEEIGCLKYLQVFEEQDVDLRIFLTLTESDLKEIGITLFGPKRKMTSAIARWHSSARPPSDALELAYADRLEAEMQELAIQLHKRCEEVQVMKGQVCQEQKLRAVAESCLMERDETWNAIQCQLREAQAITKDAGVLLDQIKSCQAELSARLGPERADEGAPDTRERRGTRESRRPGERPVLEGWPPSLKFLSLPELSAVLEECVGEMGKALQSVTQNLQRLQALGQSGQSWPKP